MLTSTSTVEPVRDVRWSVDPGSSAKVDLWRSRMNGAGAVESRFRICDSDFLNHRIQIVAGSLRTSAAS
jgi:hypothetical protein